MSDNTYNGWANYPTWVTALWLDFSDEWIVEMARANRGNPGAAGEALRDSLEELREDSGFELGPEYGMETDLFTWAWGMVDWYEIGEHMLEDLEHEDEDEETDDDDDE